MMAQLYLLSNEYCQHQEQMASQLYCTASAGMRLSKYSSMGGNQLYPCRLTAIMVFGSKPKKPNSIKPGDKRRISLLNSDFKVVTGLEGDRFGKTATHSLSPVQLVAGSDRRIHHGINLARDAIHQAGKRKAGCGLLDLDFMAGFDWLDMSWVYLVLAKKGVRQEVIERLQHVYTVSNTVVVVNNVLGSSFPNIRGSLRQGDVPSMFWFAVGIDPLLVYLGLGQVEGYPDPGRYTSSVYPVV